MSTRSTIASGDQWHLFEDCMDDQIYIEWDSPPLLIEIPIPPEAVKALQNYLTKEV